MTLPRRLASVAVASALLGGATVPVATAHSVLLSVAPEDGAELEASPGEVVLTFNEEVNQNFASVAVTSEADRTNRAAGEPVVDGPTVTAQVEELPPGTYTVGYRVTSADGHVVGGSSEFTVAGGETAASGDAAPGAAEGADDDTADTADAADEAAAEDSGLNPVIWVVAGLAVLLVGGAFVPLRRGN